MVDDRYARNERYVNGLSKWVRKNVNHFSSCGNMFNHLETFVKDMKQFDKEEQELQLQAEALKQIEDNNDKQVNSEVTNDDTIDTAIPTVTSAWKKPLDNVDANETLSAKLAKLQVSILIHQLILIKEATILLIKLTVIQMVTLKLIMMRMTTEKLIFISGVVNESPELPANQEPHVCERIN